MSRPIRVLLIEDNPGDADLIVETLESGTHSIQVFVSIDGTHAIKHLQEQLSFGSLDRPDLILLDLNLPKMDGRQVLAELKRDAAWKKIPVVILTSSDAEHDVAKSYELGAACYVTKPVGLAAFQAAVRSIAHFWLTVAKLP
jgi:CheY-like chemotaxis protein